MEKTKISIVKQVELAHRRFDGKNAILHYPPLWVTVAISGGCAFKCEFCCCHNPDSGANDKTAHQYKMSYHMTMDDFKKIINLCYDANVPRVHICAAGEPFLHPKILEFIDYEISVYSQVSLQTDFWKPLFEKKKFIDEIIKRGNSIPFITTDIFPEEVHNDIKKGSDFDYLLYCMEKISRNSDILFSAHVILTKKTYKGLSELALTLKKKSIRFNLDINNLFPLGFNDFTSMDNIYHSSDSDISYELKRLKSIAKQFDISVRIPTPYDKVNTSDGFACMDFWQKVQLVPSKKLKKERWRGNAILQQCPAVVLGDMYSVGNLFDFDNFMDFWNNETLVNIRKKIIAGDIPDDACQLCYLFNGGVNGSSKILKYLKQPWFFLWQRFLKNR